MNFIPARENEEMSLKNEFLRCIRYNRAVERKAMTDHCQKVPIKRKRRDGDIWIVSVGI